MDKKGFKSIKISLTDKEFLFIARKAHELDITWNEMATKILMEGLLKLEKSLIKKKMKNNPTLA